MLEQLGNSEIMILEFVQEYMHTPILDKIMVFLTTIGYAGAVWLLIGMGLLWFKNQRQKGVFLILTLIGILLLGELILKDLIARARPCHVQPIENMLIAIPSSFSFPSGHTGSSFACATFLGLIYKKWRIPLYIFASALAFSRIYLYVHYVSDVIAGMLLGIGVGYIFYILWKKKSEKMTTVNNA